MVTDQSSTSHCKRRYFSSIVKVNHQQDKMPILPHEDYCVCPYDRSHHVLPHRFAKHLWKCARNYTGTDVISCVYGCSHIPVEAMEDHMKRCPMKDVVEDLKKALSTGN